MRAPAVLAVLASAAATFALPLGAAQGGEGGDEGDGAGAAPGLTLAMFHPHDLVDPLGFAFAPDGSDGFDSRYGDMLAATGTYSYPVLVVDGLLPVQGIVDPERPYASTREAYAAAIAERSRLDAPVSLRLSSQVESGSLEVQLTVRPDEPIAGERLRAWVAVLEDPVHYEPPTGLTNGVFDHRFTVRALEDLGPVDLAAGPGSPVDVGASFTLPPTWQAPRLLVAAWLQQDASYGLRFAPREVVQATHAPAGQAVEQTGKGVLVEALSATWCEPCLIGDTALESIAEEAGIAEPLRGESQGYLRSPRNPWLALAAAAAGVLAAVAAWRLVR